VWWRGRLVCAIDGSSPPCPDTPANLAVYRRGGGGRGETGYPLVRLLALVACGTRAILEATFGSTGRGETSYVADLVGALRPGMIVLGDRNFGCRPVIRAIAGAGADLLIRLRADRRPPVCRRCTDGSYLSRIGPVEVRVVCCLVRITTGEVSRSEPYLLITTVTDPACPAAELVRLYHERWEIETAFCELKSTILGGRVLRARTPDGVAQELYALLVAYQALRITIADAALTRPGLDPDRGSFTVALTAARDQIIQAAGVIAASSTDLVGAIGRQVLDSPLPARRCRTSPRVVKRAISVYAPNTAKGRLRAPSHRATISVEILRGPAP
jgi:hypothetical protein